MISNIGYMYNPLLILLKTLIRSLSTATERYGSIKFLSRGRFLGAAGSRVTDCREDLKTYEERIALYEA